MSILLANTLQGRQIVRVEPSSPVATDEKVYGFTLTLDNGASVEFHADEEWGGIFIRYSVVRASGSEYENLT